MQNGKGDSPRPREVSKEVWEDNWDKIFDNNTYEEWLTEQPKDEDDERRDRSD